MLVTLSILSSIFYAIFGTSTSVMSTVPNSQHFYYLTNTSSVTGMSIPSSYKAQGGSTPASLTTTRIIASNYSVSVANCGFFGQSCNGQALPTYQTTYQVVQTKQTYVAGSYGQQVSVPSYFNLPASGVPRSLQ